MFEEIFVRAEAIVLATERNFRDDKRVMRSCDRLRESVQGRDPGAIEKALASLAGELAGNEWVLLLVDQMRVLGNDIHSYWYDHRRELQAEMIFRLHDDSLVKLDRRVPGDGTKWYVADWHNGWMHEDSTIEPGDLCGAPLDEVPASKPAARRP